MIHQLRSVWADFVQPMLKRPERVQYAALCYDRDGPDKRILLVTSRGTGRWIIPKGWPIRGLNSAGVALREAWEEAGVARGSPWAAPIGSYVYDKGLEGDWSVRVVTHVYPVRVERLSDAYPEEPERERRWVSPQEAAALVQEPELKEILASF